MILIQFILVHYAFILIAEKYKVRDRVRAIAQKLGAKKYGAKLGKFLYEVAECKFCISHHIGAVMLPFFFIGVGFEWVYLLYPLMSTGALFLITKDKEV